MDMPVGFYASDWQKKIYLEGFSGTRPVVPTDSKTLEHAAETCMSARAFAYVSGGAGEQITIASNRLAFQQYAIVPRVLRNVSSRNTTVNLFGRTLPAPLLMAPIGVLDLVHPDADIAVARAAAGLGIPFIFSNQASVPMEVCAGEMGDCPRWFQLYWSKSRELVASFVRRAEQAGCEAIVVTLDTSMLGWRPMDLNLGYLPFLEGRGIAQYTSDPVFLQMIDQRSSPGPRPKPGYRTIRGLISMVRRYPGKGFISKLRSGKPMKAVSTFVETYSNPATTWEDLSFLRAMTKLKIVLKGILHPDDARRAIDMGMDAIIVSNHGGRQVDGAIATIQALPDVVHAVRGQLPVLLDSGVRSGSDIFKALALGASAVCLGRPYVYGLAIAGQTGVDHVVRHLMADFELTMALSGCSAIDEINPGLIKKV